MLMQQLAHDGIDGLELLETTFLDELARVARLV